MIFHNMWSKNEKLKSSIIINHMFEKSIANFSEFLIICIFSVHDLVLNEVLADHIVPA